MSKPDGKEEMIARIVASYAARNDVGDDDIVRLFRKLSAEASEGDDVPDAPVPMAAGEGGDKISRADPVIPIDRAVTEDRVFCLCCGRGFKMLKWHLGAEHGLTETEYRIMFGLSEDMPLVAPSYSRRKAAHAKQAGFGRYDRSGTAQPEDAES